MPPPHSRRQGILSLLWLALALLLGLGFASNWVRSQSQADQAHAYPQVSKARALADLGLVWGRSEVASRLRTPGPARTELLETLSTEPLRLELGAGLPELGPRSSMKVQVQVRDLEELAKARGQPWSDPEEFAGTLEIQAQAKVGAGWAEARETRQFWLQHPRLPVLGRFGLWVARPGPGTSEDSFWNRVSFSDQALEAGSRSRELPLVLFNHGLPPRGPSHSLDSAGWVYLGGSRSISLELTPGSDLFWGEDFHQESLRARSPHPNWPPPGSLVRRGPFASLHLFGSPLFPSPTRVFGRVRKRTTQGHLEGRDAPLASASLAYQAGVDTMLSSPSGSKPKPLLPPGSYPHPPDQMALAFPSGQSHFQGDPAQVDSPSLARRALFEVQDQHEFRARFLKEDRLRLDRPVRLRQGSLTLPDSLRVEGGGMIVVPGEIHFEGIELAPAQRLTLVSLEGNLRSSFHTGSLQDPLRVDLVALRGRLIPEDPWQPVYLEGTLAVAELRPLEFPAGGAWIYPPDADPTDPARIEEVRGYLSDRTLGGHP